MLIITYEMYQDDTRSAARGVYQTEGGISSFPLAFFMGGQNGK